MIKVSARTIEETYDELGMLHRPIFLSQNYSSSYFLFTVYT